VVFKVLIALAVAYVIFRIGLAVLRMLATPLPEPPPAGELRKVKLAYRCDICGAEVTMKVAPTEDPEAPRHCMDDMRLMTPVEDR
jgi:hypothetical protein